MVHSLYYAVLGNLCATVTSCHYKYNACTALKGQILTDHAASCIHATAALHSCKLSKFGISQITTLLRRHLGDLFVNPATDAQQFESKVGEGVGVGSFAKDAVDVTTD